MATACLEKYEYITNFGLFWLQLSSEIPVKTKSLGIDIGVFSLFRLCGWAKAPRRVKQGDGAFRRTKNLHRKKNWSASCIQSIPHGFIACHHPVRCRRPAVIIFKVVNFIVSKQLCICNLIAPRPGIAQTSESTCITDTGGERIRLLQVLPINLIFLRRRLYTPNNQIIVRTSQA